MTSHGIATTGLAGLWGTILTLKTCRRFWTSLFATLAGAPTASTMRGEIIHKPNCLEPHHSVGSVTTGLEVTPTWFIFTI